MVRRRDGETRFRVEKEWWCNDGFGAKVFAARAVTRSAPMNCIIKSQSCRINQRKWILASEGEDMWSSVGDAEDEEKERFRGGEATQEIF